MPEKETDPTADKVRPEFTDVQAVDFTHEPFTDKTELKYIMYDVPQELGREAKHRSSLATGAALRLQQSLPILAGKPWDDLPSVEAHSANYSIWESSIILPDSPMFQPVYSQLTTMLEDPDADESTKLAAVVLGDAVMNQTAIPLTEKTIYKVAIQNVYGREKETKVLMQTAAHFEKEELTVESQQAFAGMLARTEVFLADIEQSLSQRPESRETYLQQLLVLNQMLSRTETGFYQKVILSCSQALRERLGAIESSAALSLTLNGWGADVLASGELDDYQRSLRAGMWRGAILHAHAPAEDADAGLETMADYFFTSPDIQESYWSTTQGLDSDALDLNQVVVSDATPKGMVVPFAYFETELFFLQPEARLEAFFQTYPTGKDKKTNEKMFRLMTANLAALQSLHPDHPNIALIHESLQTIAEQTHVPKRATSALAILRDEVPGVITLSKQGVRATRSTSTADSMSPGDHLLYASKATLEIKTSPVEKPVQQAAEVAPKEEVLVIAAGQPEQHQFWGEVQHPREADTARILNHLSERLANRNPAEDALLDLAAQDIPKGTPHPKVTVLPSLLDADHELAVLAETGIVSIERTGDSFSFLVDAKGAGVAVAGAPMLVLTGEKTDTNELQIVGAPEDFDGTLLHLALTGAALSSYRRPPEEGKIGKKVADRITQVPGMVTEWNRDTRGKGYPQVSNVSPTPDETAVIMPVSKTNVVLLTMRQ